MRHWVSKQGDRQLDSLTAAIINFQNELPGWWFSLGECSVSSDASCGPDKDGVDAALLKNVEFDQGFHADLEQPSTLAQALYNVTEQALEAKMSIEQAVGG